LPAFYAELEQRLTTRPRQHPVLAPARGKRRTEISPSDDLLDTRSAARNVISSWARLVADERRVTPVRKTPWDITCAVLFLDAHLDWLLAHQAATEFVDEISDLMAAVGIQCEHGALPRMPTYTCVVAGCEAKLRAALRRCGEHLAAEIRCGNGHAWTADQWLRLKRAMERREAPEPAPPSRSTVSTKAAALALGVPEGTIRQWARRGKLTRYGTGWHAEYDLRELCELAENREQRGRV
jgi:hypothetical protein